MTARFFQIAALLLLFAQSGAGQRLDSEDLADSFVDLALPPKDRLVDLGEVFRDDPASRERLSRRLDSLAEHYQFSVHFVAYSGIIGSNVLEKAELFRDNWLGSEEEGLVFVCDTDMKNMAYAFTKIDSLPMDGQGPSWKLPDDEANKAMFELKNVVSQGMTEEQYLDAIGNKLVNELEKRLQVRAEPKKAKVRGFFITFIPLAVLMALGVWWLQRKSKIQNSFQGRASFPRMEICNRLGGQFGGGSVSEIAFEPASRPDGP